MKKNIILIIIAIIVIILVTFIVEGYYHREDKNLLSEAIKNKKDYSIVYISGNNSVNLAIEDYLILDSNKKVIQEIEIITGYTNDELNNQYNLIKENGGETAYNVKIRDKSLIYSSVIFNGKNINEVIEGFKSSGYTNLVIREI